MDLDRLLDNAQDYLQCHDYAGAAGFVRAYDEAISAGAHTTPSLEAEANYISRRIREAQPELSRLN